MRIPTRSLASVVLFHLCAVYGAATSACGADAPPDPGEDVFGDASPGDVAPDAASDPDATADPDAASDPDATADAIAVPDVPDPAVLACLDDPDDWDPRPLWGRIRSQVPDYATPSKNFNLIDTIQLLQSLVTGASKAIDEAETVIAGGQLHGWCICEGVLDCVVSNLADLDGHVQTMGVAMTNKLLDLEAWHAIIDGSVTTAWDTTVAAGTELADAVATAAQELATALAGVTLAEVSEQLAVCFESAVTTEFKSVTVDLRDYALSHWRPVAELLADLRDYFQGLSSLGDLRASFDELLDLAKRSVDVYNTHVKVLFEGTGPLGALTDLLDAHRAAFEQRVKDCLEAAYSGPQQAIDTFLDAIRAALEAKTEAVLEQWKNVRADLSGLVQAFTGAADQVQQGAFWEALFKDFFDQTVKKVLGCAAWLPLEVCNGDPGDADTLGCNEPPDHGAFVMWLPTDVHKQPAQGALFVLRYTGLLDKAKEWLDKLLSRAGGFAENLLTALENTEQILRIIFEYMDRFVEGYHLGGYDLLRPALHHCVGYAGHGAYARMASLAGGKVNVGARYTSHNLSRKQRFQFRSGGFGIEAFGNAFSLVPSVEALVQIDGFRMWDPNRPFGLPMSASVNLEKSGVFHLLRDDATPPPEDSAADAMKVPNYQPGQPYNLANLLFDPMFPVEYDATGDDQPPWNAFPRPANDRFDESSVAVVAVGLNLPLEVAPSRTELATVAIYPPIAYLTPWYAIKAGIGWFHEANHFRGAIKAGITRRIPQVTLDDAVFARDDYPAHDMQAPDLTDDMGTRAFVEPAIGADLTLGLKIAKFLTIGVNVGIGLSVNIGVNGTGGVLDLNKNLADVLARSNPPREAPCEPIVDPQKRRVCSNQLATFKGHSRSTVAYACDGEDGLDAIWHATRGLMRDLLARMERFGELTGALWKAKRIDLEAELEACRKGWDDEWLAVRDAVGAVISEIDALSRAGSATAVQSLVATTVASVAVLEPRIRGLRERVESLAQPCYDALEDEVRAGVDDFYELVAQLEADVTTRLADAVASTFAGSECQQHGYCVLPDGSIQHDVTEAECASLADPAATDLGVCCYGHASPDDQLPDHVVACNGGVDDVKRRPPLDAQVYAKTTRAACAGVGSFTAFADGGAEPDVVTRTFKHVAPAQGEFMCATLFQGPDTYTSACGAGVQPFPTQDLPFRVIFRNPVKTGGGAPELYPYSCITQLEPKVTGWRGPGCHPLVHGFPSACGCGDGEACATGEACDDEAGLCRDDGPDCVCDPGKDEVCGAGRACVRGACARECSSDADCASFEECVAGDTAGEQVCVRKFGIPYAEEVAWLMRQKDAPSHAVATYALSTLELTAYLHAALNISAELKLFFLKLKLTLFDWKDFWELAALNRAWYQPGLVAEYEQMCHDFDHDVPSYDRGRLVNHQPATVTRYGSDPDLEEFLRWCKRDLHRSGAERFRSWREAPNPARIVDDVNQTLVWSHDIARRFWEMRADLCGEGVGLEQILQDLGARAYDWMCVWDRGGDAIRFPCRDMDLMILEEVGCFADHPAPAGLASYARVGPGGTTRWDLRAMLLDPTLPVAAEHFSPAVVATPGFAAWLEALRGCVEARFESGDTRIRVEVDGLEDCGGMRGDDGDVDGWGSVEPGDPGGGGSGGAVGHYGRPEGRLGPAAGRRDGGVGLSWEVGGGGGADSERDPFGACCQQDVGCVDGLTSAECRGEFTGGASCADLGPCREPRSDDPTKDPYNRHGACCLRNPRPGEAPCAMGRLWECQGCFYEVNSCSEVDLCDPASVWLDCPPTDGGPGTGGDGGGEGGGDTPCGDPVPSCGDDHELLIASCGAVAPPEPSDCPPGATPYVECAAAGVACGESYVCTRVGCRVPAPPTCGDGTLTGVPACPTVVVVTDAPVVLAASVGDPASEPRWTPPDEACEVDGTAGARTYDAFRVRNGLGADKTWALTGSFEGKGLIHAYAGSFDPLTGGAGMPAMCLGGFDPAATGLVLPVKAGQELTLVLTAETAAPGTEARVVVTPAP